MTFLGDRDRDWDRDGDGDGDGWTDTRMDRQTFLRKYYFRLQTNGNGRFPFCKVK